MIRGIAMGCLWLTLQACTDTDNNTVAFDSGASEVVAFELIETDIATVHRAVREGRLSFQELTAAYLKRIEAYDQSSGLNAIVVVNPDALADARRLDEAFQRNGKLLPLHGIPVIVKDNYNTRGLQTTAGSAALRGMQPAYDAFQVRRLREAGAVILAKSNMAEWAFSPYVTESSIAGITRNPYDLERVPAGSSGGTAASVAANLGLVGLGTDTGNSIRGPSAHNALVGIRSSMGLASRDGIVPLFLRNDIGGPMTRTVADAAMVLEVIAGYDPNDPVTAQCAAETPLNYQQFLDHDGLHGARVGVFRRYLDAADGDPEVKAITEQALVAMRAAGAEIIDPVDIPDYEPLIENLWCDTMQHDVNRYLEQLGDAAPYRSLAEIVATGQYAGYIEEALQQVTANQTAPEAMEPPCLNVYQDSRNIAFREALTGMMTAQRLDAVVYPTWSNPPRRVGDMESPAGDNSQFLSPHTGLPAITVPSGFTRSGLPVGLTFIAGALCAEGPLIRLAYAFEQTTQHRRPPSGFGVLTEKN